MKLRALDLRSLDDVIAEVRRLRDGGYTPRGKWSLSQMSDHLTQTMRVGIDGDEPRLSWPVRKVIGLVFRWIVMPSRSMRAGMPTVPRLTPAPLATDDPARIERLITTLAEARDFTGPMKPYVLMDGLSLDEWKDLMVIHAQHHLRFLEPRV